MMSKGYTLRFYRIHDLDLITLIETHEINIVKTIYTVLTAYSEGEVFVIDIPPKRMEELPKLSRVYTKKMILDEETDTKAIRVMEKINKGYRNNFLKNLLRLYLCCPLSELFLNDAQDMQYFSDSFSVFKTGKKIVRAGRIRKRKIPASIVKSTTNLPSLETATQALAYQAVQNIDSNAEPENLFVSENELETESKGRSVEQAESIPAPDILDVDRKNTDINEKEVEDSLTDLFSSLLY